MNTKQAIGQAMGRAGLNGADLERKKIMARSSYSRKMKLPDTFTLGDLIKMNREVHFTDEELRAMISG